MQGSLGQPPIIIRSSRLVAATMLLIVVGFAATGLLMARDPEENPVVAYFVTGFFALGIPIFGWRLFRPDTLTLTSDGIIRQHMLRTDSWSWNEVQDFRPYRPTGKTILKHIGFNFTDSERTDVLSQESTEVEGSLGNGWELGAADLADLLNKARGQWLRSRRH
jgi:hypothetical protein